MRAFLEAFIPLFVALNTLGVLPIYLGLTEGLSPTERRRLVYQALSAAFGLALLILFAGQFVFRFLGITLHDLRVAGGLILLVLGIYDVLFSVEERRRRDASAGVVPIGIPLTVGPAAITTILVLVSQYGYLITLLALVANLVLSGLILLFGGHIRRVTGEAGAKAFGKIASLFLSAIAVSMIRSGITGMLRPAP
ncbi:MAG: MarC family protein [Bacteroidetes bacterium]|nr:MarC family protein [Rhodothermia bacterium]MCS7154223.1 MarC family protein [Bacteroidota bacterium]MCX7906741.1 MarC family protein [Bacteroidota bacterium]MDW8136979.1 MarC family protein [Bacteroidota bacterium]MDW8285150.1 MarC family protein [Bacteroidota bacterium]